MEGRGGERGKKEEKVGRDERNRRNEDVKRAGGERRGEKKQGR